MIDSKIKILIYGSGSQLIFIKKLLEKDKSQKRNLLSEVFSYEGLIQRGIFANLLRPIVYY